MPYIKQERRTSINKALVPIIAHITHKSDICAGDINFIITRIVSQFLAKKGESYATYNEIVGVLECAKLEFYRRRIAKYENSKIKSNGDVY